MTLDAFPGINGKLQIRFDKHKCFILTNTMMDTKKILTCSTQLILLRNGEHFQYHQDILEDVPEEVAETYHFGPQRAAYVSIFDYEDLIYKQNYAYASTADITSKDHIRGELFLFMKGIIDAYMHCPTEEKKAAAQVLSYVIKPYRSANNKSYSENTAEITNLVKSLRLEENTQAVTTLGLQDIVDQLEAANIDFNTAFKARSAEKRGRKVQMNMRDVRPQVDAAYNEMANAINVIYQANEMVQKDEETRTVLGGIIDKINALIVEVNDKLTRRGQGTKTETTETPNTPEEPVKLEITAVYSKVKDPYDATGITRGKETLMEWTGGFELVNEKGDGPGKIVVIAENSSIEEIVPAEDILARSNKGCEFIMIRDFAEGNYKIRIETYHEGKPLSLEYAKIIKLV